jgi:hypothetical protein
MAKCITCGKSEVASDGWTWQPFGPNDKIASFTTPGYHYRGFPALHVCDMCKLAIQRGESVAFRFRGKTFVFEHGVMEAI